RIRSRVGDLEAKKLEDAFGSFGAPDLQSLGVGEAICRIERADWDFTLRTLALPEVASQVTSARRDRIVARSRERYGTPRAEVEALLREARAPIAEPEPTPRVALRLKEPTPQVATVREPAASRSHPPAPSAAREAALVEGAPASRFKEPALGRGGAQHRYL